MLECRSDVFISDVQGLSRKGLNVDDVTLEYCMGRVPDLWPNTLAPISALRFFRPWNPDWNRPRRKRAIEQIASYAIENGAKVLLTTEVTCIEEHDEENWRWTKELLQRLGPNNVLGLQVGHEIDQFYRSVVKTCAQSLWDNGRFWSEFQMRVKEMDEMGFRHVPITVGLSVHSIKD